ncbi:THO2 plays a role in transcriptional elongation, partial [Spiromyces aspiralis]
MIVDELVRESIIDSAVLQSIRSESIPSDEGFELLAVQVRSLPNSLSRIVQDLLRIFCLPTLRPSDGSSNFQDAGKGLRFPAPSVLCRIFDVVLKALDSRSDDSNSTSKDTGGEEQSRESAQEGQSLADSDDAKKQEVKRSLERAILNNVWSLCIEWEADGPSFGSAAAARGQAGKAEAPEWVRRMDEVHARCMGQLMVVVRALLDAGIITTSEAKIRLEPGFLERVGAIESARVLTAYATRLRTMALYKQDKFNLLQEESQGFAKVIATLGMSMLAFRRRVEEKEQAETRPATNGLPATDQKASPTRMETEPSEGVSLTSSERALWDIQNDTALINEVERLWESINFTIGTFDIDPNRVVDLILDFFIARVKQDWRFFIA